MSEKSPAQLAVLISGNGSNLQAIIDHIESGQLNAEIAIVISNKADAYGLQRAKSHNIPTRVIAPEKDESREAYDARLIEILDKLNCDFILLSGFMRILSTQFVEHYLGKLLNIHPSLLPKYKGLNTHQRALDAGDSRHGASVHFVTPELDDGPVIAQAHIDILPDDSATSLADRLLTQEHRLYSHTVQLCIDGRVKYYDNHLMLDGKQLNTPLLISGA